MSEPLLSVSELRTQFRTSGQLVRAVDGISFDVHPGETVCLVGESGSGKTVACESITRLLDQPPAEYVGGEVIFDGVDLASLPSKQLRTYRGGRIGYVFQNPQQSLSPVATVGDQIVEAMEIHDVATGADARDRAIDLLHRVGVPRPAVRVDDYPHELSGGMQQRVAIAAALAAEPDLLVADEPTTAVDLTIQAQILDLLADLRETLDLAVVLVTHDFRVVAELADRVVVLYDGKVMERGSVEAIFDEPAHPYTQLLFDAAARERSARETGDGDGRAIEGEGKEKDDGENAGCRFSRDCPHAVADCRHGDQPPLRETGTGSRAACLFYDEDRNSSAVRRVQRPDAGGGQ